MNPHSSIALMMPISMLVSCRSSLIRGDVGQKLNLPV